MLYDSSSSFVNDWIDGVKFNPKVQGGQEEVWDVNEPGQEK